MRTTCPSCETAYTIPDDRIGPKGRKVRCARCGEEWRIRSAEDAAPPPASDVFDDPPMRARAEAPPAEDEVVAFAEPAVRAAPPPSPPREIAPEEPPPRVAIAADSGPVAAEAQKRPPRPVHRHHLPHLHLPMLPVLPQRFADFGGPVVFLAACLVCVGLVVFRSEVVARLPGLAGFYRTVGLDVNLRGIVFGGIETLRETEDGKPVLVVEGTLTNTTGESRAVPALRFSLRDDEAQELYAWSIDPRATTIAAGDRLRFRTRLVAPPERAADLQVRFAERRNRQAGLP